MKYRRFSAAAILAALIATAAIAAGSYSTFPIIGKSSFCVATVTGTAPGGTTGQGVGTIGSICAQTVPAGPPLVGDAYLFPADTLQAGGASPQTVTVPALGLAGYTRGTAGNVGFINSLVCGDASTCPFQRGTSQAADITSTTTYGPDYWAFKGGASSAINWSKVTAAADIPTGGRYSAALRFQRKSANADTTAICMSQVLTSADSYRYQGHSAVFQFWAKAGALFSPTSSNINVTVAYGTDTDGSQDNFFKGASSGWTNYTSGVLTQAAGNPSQVTAAADISQVISTTWTNYSFSVPIPQFATGTTATSQIGVKVCFTPVGTAGATDFVEFAGVQLAVNDALNAIAFDHRPTAVELQLAQFRYWQATESATAIQVRGTCAYSTTSVANCNIRFPRTMRSAPTMTYATGFESCATTACSSATACTALATATSLTGNAASVDGVVMSCASSAGFPAAGTSGFIWDVGTGTPTGAIKASADL